MELVELSSDPSGSIRNPEATGCNNIVVMISRTAAEVTPRNELVLGTVIVIEIRGTE
jgi:hypothetical protein